MSELDAIVEKSLLSFYRNICSEWSGRENEMVNLYALGHLVKHVQPGTILSELAQIRIEVAVRQLAPDEEPPGKMRDGPQRFGHLANRRNDSLESERSAQRPLAVMEWKVNHFLNRAVHEQNRREHLQDIRWLRQTSLRLGSGEFVGYAVMVENVRIPKSLSCTRVHAGADTEFLTLADN